MVLILLLLIVYRNKSSSKTRDITDMTNFVKNEGLNNPFKGELIENELYQSADNMVDKNNIYSHPIEHGSMWIQNWNRRKSNAIVLQICKNNWNASKQLTRQF